MMERTLRRGLVSPVTVHSSIVSIETRMAIGRRRRRVAVAGHVVDGG